MPADLVTLGVVCADIMARPVDALPERGKLALVPQMELHLGGLAGATAAVFSQLGGSAAYTGHLGSDRFGDFILQALDSAGVETASVARLPGCGSPATVVLIAEDGERTFLYHSGPNDEFTAADIGLASIGQAKMLHWGGPSIFPKLDGAPMGHILREARELGLRTSVDTCFDSSGVWLPLLEPSLPHLNVVFSNHTEALHYTGENEAPKMADFFAGYGVETVVIKMGAEGLYARNGSQEVRLPAHDVEVVDTTGAGDACCGAFLFGYLSGWDLERCARLANAVGALTVQRMGGAEAIESLDQVLNFMENVAC